MERNLQNAIQQLTDSTKIYDSWHIPSQIGQAIYLFGSNDITEIIAFIDTSDMQDGTSGLIITPQKLYYHLEKKGYLAYQDIVALSIEKHRHDQGSIGVVKTSTQEHVFQGDEICNENLIQLLALLCDKDIERILTIPEKIAYYVQVVLSDIQNDEYEDIDLSDQQLHTIHEFEEELHIIEQLDDENYQYELQLLCPKALQFFDELELDSDEIDILLDIQKQLTQEQEKENDMFDQARQYYDDMMNKYQQGDTKMYDQMKNAMNMLGIHPEDLQGKSPEEIQHYLEDLCDRFGISKSQLDHLMKKFQGKTH